MQIKHTGEVIRVSGIRELGHANSQQFRDAVASEVRKGIKEIKIDLRETAFVDACGLGALISLHKKMSIIQGEVCLLNPTPPVQQILELTRMHRIFKVVKE